MKETTNFLLSLQVTENKSVEKFLNQLTSDFTQYVKHEGGFDPIKTAEKWNGTFADLKGHPAISLDSL